MLFTIERICNCKRIPKDVTCSLKNPWRSPGALCSNHTQTNYAPVSLPASIRFYLPLSPGVDIREGERETAISGSPFSEIPRVHFASFALSFCLAFSSHQPNIFWNHQTHRVNSVIMSSKANDRKVSAKKEVFAVFC